NFFLGTLAISQKPVYKAHKRKNEFTGAAARYTQGKHIKKKVSPDDKNFVRKHINTFPRVESHYCRSDTKKEYLDPSLSISKCIIYTENHWRNIFQKKAL